MPKPTHPTAKMGAELDVARGGDAVPLLEASNGFMSKISTPCILPRISRRSSPVAWSRSVGTVPGAAPGGRRSASVLISGRRRQPCRLPSAQVRDYDALHCIASMIPRRKTAKELRRHGAVEHIPSKGIIFGSTWPGLGSPESLVAYPVRTRDVSVFVGLYEQESWYLNVPRGGGSRIVEWFLTPDDGGCDGAPCNGRHSRSPREGDGGT